jgi:hypothetical protein
MNKIHAKSEVSIVCQALDVWNNLGLKLGSR